MIDNQITQAIRLRIGELRLRTGTIVISISRDAVEEVFGDGECLLIRWICWSVNDSQGQEVSAPEFHIVHPSLTIDRLQRDIGTKYQEFDIIFDHNVGSIET